jgi:hypothetical protein
MAIESRKSSANLLIFAGLFLLLNTFFELGYDLLSWCMFALAWLFAGIVRYRGGAF